MDIEHGKIIPSLVACKHAVDTDERILERIEIYNAEHVYDKYAIPLSLDYHRAAARRGRRIICRTGDGISAVEPIVHLLLPPDMVSCCDDIRSRREYTLRGFRIDTVARRGIFAVYDRKVDAVLAAETA